MSCKAFNGRVVLEYLSEVARLAAQKLPARGAGRLFGSWLVNAVASGAAEFPRDPKIPLQAVAMCSGQK